MASRQFGLLSVTAPGERFSFLATLGSVSVGSPIAGSTPFLRASRAETVLKTRAVYHDAPTLELAYQLFDAEARTRVDHVGLAVEVRVSVGGDDPASAVAACGAPDSVSGVGACALVIPQHWFSAPSLDRRANASLVAAYTGHGGAPATGALAGSFTVAAKPIPVVSAATFGSLASGAPLGAGVTATLPHHPVGISWAPKPVISS